MLDIKHNNPSLLRLIDFANFDNWDVKTYLAKKLEANFPYTPLSECIIEQNTKVKPYDFPDDDFEILGVDNKNGIFDAYVEKGKNIKQQYKVVEDNFVAYNPYRINVGSIGLKDSTHKHKYISPAYVVFSCKENLLAKYLYILFKTPIFNKVIRDTTTGSVRQNLSFDNLSEMQIPLPSIADQEIIILDYETKIQEAERLKNDAEQITQKLNETFLDKIEVSINNIRVFNKNHLNFYSLIDLTRWDLWNLDGEIISNKYPLSTFKDVVIGKPMYGANVKGVNKLSETRYIRITDINEDGRLNNEFVSPEFVEDKYLLKQNDFLLARSGNTVGKSFLYNEEFGRAIFAGYLVKYNLNFDLIDPKFLFYFTKSPIFKFWIKKNQRISGQPNINGQEYLEFPLVIPKLQVQLQIVKEMDEIQKERAKIIDKAMQLKAQAIDDFQTAIFT